VPARVAHSRARGLDYTSCDAPMEKLRITDYVDEEGVIRGKVPGPDLAAA
jgi:hypothetical protein